MSRWYIGTDTGSKVLAHYAKGASAKDHKWKTRSLRNGHWVYVYDGDGSKSEGTGSDSGASNLDRVKNQTAQRKSMNAQAETQKNATQPWNRATFPSHADRNPKTPEDYDRLAKREELHNGQTPKYYDLFEKKLKAISRQQDQNLVKIEVNGKPVTDDSKNKTDAMKAQNRYGEIQKRYDKRAKNRETVEAEKSINDLYDLVSRYEKIGYKLPKNVGQLKVYNNPDARIVMTNPKTGKTVTLPTARELMKSSKKQEEILRKNGNNPSSSTQQQTTPSAKTHEVNSNGFKARPATAADADLFKNKSSAEIKNKVTISDHGGNTGIKTEVTKKKKKRL